MTHKKPVIVGIGEVLWDVFPTGKRAGGAPMNLVYHATQLGAEGYAISAVGNDLPGTELINEMDTNNIRHCTAVVEHPTGSVMVELTDGIPSYTIVDSVAWDNVPASKEAKAIVKRADAIAFGTLAQRSEVSRKNLKKLIKATPDDCIRYFDINLRQQFYNEKTIRKLLKLSTILKINDEELEIIKPMFGLENLSDEEAIVKLIRKYDLRYVILTAGSRYSHIYNKKGLYSAIDTPKVIVADTVGAGDSFSGAFLHSVLSGMSVYEAHKKAVEIAAFVCTQHGAWPSYELMNP
ncbi:MAG: carbohydrate kinase [Capnocytophaga sp.]|nr:carbohydrate kinase [Capnocytophaga sp.]